ncbi:hypothetical protein WMO66_08725, partial [Faecousia sp. CLA-AA-H192]
GGKAANGCAIFQVFHTDGLTKKIRHLPQMIDSELPKVMKSQKAYRAPESRGIHERIYQRAEKAVRGRAGIAA